MGNLAGKTFEVQVSDGKRWETVDIHKSRSAAVEVATNVADTANHYAVRVIAESDRTGTEVVFHEELGDDGKKTLTIVPLTEAALCEEAGDIFGLDARRTIGRVMRNYLEEHGVTTLELLFDRTRHILLEREGTLFPQAVQNAATVQARQLGIKPVERSEKLYGLINEMRQVSESVAEETEAFAILKTRGVIALVEHADKVFDENERRLKILRAFAALLDEARDWNGKIERVVELAAGDLDVEARGYVDEVLAEVLDGAKAIMELLGGQADAASANRQMILLSEGRCKPPKNALSCIAEFNEMMGRLELPETSGVILTHVASYIRSTRALTREGRDADRQAFSILVRDLTDVAGFRGGPDMSYAITRRARVALGTEEGDLAFPDGLERVISMLPHRAARIGYLVELSQTAISGIDKAYVLSTLAGKVKQLTSLASLVPEGASKESVNAAVDGLKARLMSEAIPEEWRKSLSETFDALMAKPRKRADGDAAKFSLHDEEYRNMVTQKPEHKNATNGEILFEEGDDGSEAYLILSGEVEIFRKVGNTEQKIAKLGRGEIFGEMSLIDNQPRMATARVLEDSQLSVITQDSLKARLDRLSRDDRVMRRLIGVLVSRLRGEAFTAP